MLLPGAAELLVFAGAVLVLNATPGVDLLLTVTRSVQGGARAGVAAALGIAAGCAAHALAAAFGLAALLALRPQAFVALQWAGAAYLAWLGVGLLRQAAREVPGAVAGSAPAPAPGFGADLRRGLLTNLLNPKVALFFLAFLPQFVPAASEAKTVSFLLLGAWFVVQSTLFLCVVVALASRVASRPGSRRLQRAAGAAGGALFIGLALRLLGARPALG
jgi:threonine/homoserine/homoserine lactone efflux protein